MIDAGTARAAIGHLKMAMVELMEDALAEVGRRPYGSGVGRELAELGADLAKLGAAAEVLRRRAAD